MPRSAGSRSRMPRPVVPASPSMNTVCGSCLVIPEKWSASAIRTERRPAAHAPIAGDGPLALAELEAAAGLGRAVLLALDHARVAGQEAGHLQDGRSSGS